MLLLLLLLLSSSSICRRQFIFFVEMYFFLFKKGLDCTWYGTAIFSLNTSTCNTKIFREKILLFCQFYNKKFNGQLSFVKVRFVIVDTLTVRRSIVRTVTCSELRKRKRSIDSHRCLEQELSVDVTRNKNAVLPVPVVEASRRRAFPPAGIDCDDGGGGGCR